MKKNTLLLLLIGFIILTSSFAQSSGLSSENFEEIKELKNSKLYVYIEEVKSSGIIGSETYKKDLISTPKYYREVIENEWNYCEYEFIDKESYKVLKNNKSLFFLTNTAKGTLGRSNGGVKKFRYLMLSKGKHQMSTFRNLKHLFILEYTPIKSNGIGSPFLSYKTNLSVSNPKEVDWKKMSKNKITSEVKLINNYLEDCITYGTAEIKEIAIENAISLKGEKIGFPQEAIRFKPDDIKNETELDATFKKRSNK
jgi:hypothetical protein